MLTCPVVLPWRWLPPIPGIHHSTEVALKAAILTFPESMIILEVASSPSHGLLDTIAVALVSQLGILQHANLRWGWGPSAG